MLQILSSYNLTIEKDIKLIGDSSDSSNSYEQNKTSDSILIFISSLKRVLLFDSNNSVFLTDLVFNFKKLNDRLVNINPKLLKLLKPLKINFSESSTNKHINLTNNFSKRSDFVFFYLRKNKIYFANIINTKNCISKFHLNFNRNPIL